jgi:hypothetical protein
MSSHCEAATKKKKQKKNLLRHEGAFIHFIQITTTKKFRPQRMMKDQTKLHRSNNIGDVPL